MALISTGNVKYHLPLRGPVTAAAKPVKLGCRISVFSPSWKKSELLLKGSHSFLFSFLNLKRIFEKEHRVVAGICSSFYRGDGGIIIHILFHVQIWKSQRNKLNYWEHQENKALWREDTFFTHVFFRTGKKSLSFSRCSN